MAGSISGRIAASRANRSKRKAMAFALPQLQYFLAVRMIDDEVMGVGWE